MKRDQIYAPAAELTPACPEVALVAWIVMAFFVISAPVVLVLPLHIVAYVAPAIFATQVVALAVGQARQPKRDRITWNALLCGIAFLVLKSYAYSRWQMAENTIPSVAADIRLWNSVTVGTTLANLVCFIWAGAKGFRPLLHVPATSASVRVGLAGFALVEGVAQWTWLGARPAGWASTALAVVSGIGAAALTAAFAALMLTLLRLRRCSDLMIAGAAMVFGVGQVLTLVGSERFNPTAGRAFVHILLATGLLAAAAFLPGMHQVGRPLAEFTDRPLNNISPLVLLTLCVADAVLAGLQKGPWGVSRVLFVMAVVVAVQTVIIVWLSGTLLGLHNWVDRFRNRRLRSELRGAVGRNELQAHFQPIIRTTDMTVAGYETLARWQHPRLGLVTANRFISIAAAEGFLAAIDHMMIRLAAEALPALLATTRAERPFLTVNVEPKRMQQVGFADRVLGDLRNRSLDPRGLIIELTETAAIDDWDQLRVNVGLFQQAGIGLAIDDFGAGHSNFGLLVELDPTLVKLDQTLVEAALNSTRGQVIVRNAVQAARSCGAHIVAEGVSDADWAQPLTDLGFDHLQGYAFGRACSASSYSPAIGPLPV
jgi:EAL domain-containing protein (putative c-di-GMP-specific phosphodiesterase class I)